MANRGIERASLFPTAETRDEFVSRLGEIAYGFAVEVNAYLGGEQLCRRDDIRVLLESNGYRFVRASDNLGIDDFYVNKSVT